MAGVCLGWELRPLLVSHVRGLVAVQLWVLLLPQYPPLNSHFLFCHDTF